jgi:hypothetical protein
MQLGESAAGLQNAVAFELNAAPSGLKTFNTRQRAKKFRDDQRATKAEIALIVIRALPKGVETLRPHCLGRPARVGAIRRRPNS